MRGHGFQPHPPPRVLCIQACAVAPGASPASQGLLPSRLVGLVHRRRPCRQGRARVARHAQRVELKGLERFEELEGARGPNLDGGLLEHLWEERWRRAAVGAGWVGVLAPPPSGECTAPPCSPSAPLACCSGPGLRLCTEAITLTNSFGGMVPPESLTGPTAFQKQWAWCSCRRLFFSRPGPQAQGLRRGSRLRWLIQKTDGLRRLGSADLAPHFPRLRAARVARGGVA